MSSEVFFSDLRSPDESSPLKKIEKLIKKCGYREIYTNQTLTAIKVHFGELGNTAYIRPVFLRPIIDLLRGNRANPFLIDTNTLYVGMRTNSVDHIANAHYNGFGFATLQTPIIIGDGLRGEDSVRLKNPADPNGEDIHIAGEILRADRLLVVSHFKGHMLGGFGGAIKNVSMGCASRYGKMSMHSTSKPNIGKKCVGCGKCVNECQVMAIELDKEKRRAKINNACVGCAHCIASCPHKAIGLSWNQKAEIVVKRMVDYLAAVYRHFDKKVIFINILTSVSPGCDCVGGNDKPVCEDIGFMASRDPVAIDRASIDQVVRACGGKNPFSEIYPHIDQKVHFDYAAEIGMKDGSYSLVKV